MSAMHPMTPPPAVQPPPAVIPSPPAVQPPPAPSAVESAPPRRRHPRPRALHPRALRLRALRPASLRRAAVAAAVTLVAVTTALLTTPSPAQGSPAQDSRAQGSPALGSPAVGSPAQGAPGAAAPDLSPALSYFSGGAFDTCEAPSVTVMRAWRASPYRAVGIYFGGRGRGCPGQRELSRSWVSTVHTLGFHLLPLFVGSQAPCVNSEAKRKYAIGRTPWRQGTQEAGDAVKAAKALGIDAASPLYLDIEAYRAGDAACRSTTVTFVRAWDREVRRLGYVPGFYSSADTGIRDIERQRVAGTPDLPSVVWFARWGGGPALDTESALSPSAWQPHARIHQYAGNVTETYGGRRMTIDRSVVDAPVARVIPQM
ncbi:DUF1906 domain-containing protein [Streptomyces sp. NPDC004327]|uniref:DUF1906 domain-containing protein n=1 Tax=Streptomyces sp. NPDC004327 TaxID=3364699 RepID=UPI003691A334